jgi:pimeloyl-ACP methyl ester carboxylesterase
MHRNLALLLLCAATHAGAVDFKPCADAASQPALAGSVCAVESVPADPSSAGSAASLSLFLRKFPTTEAASRGQVWLIAGGPGESGASFYGLLPTLRASFPGFDLLVPDHRGTGFSTRLCPDEEAPGSAGGAALEGAEWGTCFGRLNAQAAWTRQFSWTNAALDLKLLVERTPRHGQTVLYGVSYGTGLVLRALALGTRQVDQVVLDSLVPLPDDAAADLSRRSLIVDAVGRARLSECDAAPDCHARMGEPVEAIYRRVLARAATDPALQALIPGTDLKRLLGNLLDIPAAAASIPYIIKDLDAGSAARLNATLALVEKEGARLGSFPQSPPSIPLVALISGSENNLQPGRTAQAVRAEEANLLFTSALPGLLIDPGLPLYPRDAKAERPPVRLPPTLVIQGKRDAKTPYAAALRHVAVLRQAGPVRVFSSANGAHFALWHPYPCMEAAIRDFVLGVDGNHRCVALASPD